MISPKPSLDDLRIERKTRSVSARWPWVLLFLLVVLGAAGAYWWQVHSKIVPVKTAPAREIAQAGGQRTVLNASGYVTARRAATVSSKITGKVVEVFIEEGLKVQEGQILARLDDTNTRASLRLAEAQLESAKTALAETRVRIHEAELELRRQSQLLTNSVATQADFDRAEAAALALKARLTQQEAEIQVADRQVASWHQQLEDTIIRAPFAGVVTVKNAQPGEMISPISAGGGFTRTGICTIVDMQSLEIEIDVNESYINRVQSGQPVEATLDAYPAWKIPCKVIAIIPTADRQKSTVRVRVAFDQLESRILPDMSIKVAFHESLRAGSPGPSAPGVTVPKAALRQQDGKDVVFVARNGQATRRAVTVDRADGDQVVIAAGIAPGEKVIIEPRTGLSDGLSIREQR